MYRYIKDKKINYSKCGKLIVASSEKQINFLRKLKENALENGVNTKLINANKSSFLEPNLKCNGALLSDSTGIVDQNEFALSLQNDIESLGGNIILRSELTSDDFVITKTEKKYTSIISLFGIDSPGLTASLAVGDHVEKMVNSN